MIPLKKQTLADVSRAALTLVLAALLPGCASVNNVAYRPDAAHPVRSVAIASDVKMPERMVFLGFSEMMAMGVGAGLGGAVGGALMGATAPHRKALQHYRVPESLRNALAAELQRAGRFAVAQSPPVDAEVRITVLSYGFFQAGFRSE